VAQTIAPLTRLAFKALGVFSDGTTQDITADASWSSTDSVAATVSNLGIATGVAAGATTIQATLSSAMGNAPLTVSSASLTSITLTPASSGVAIGSTLLLSAVGTFSDGTNQPINLAAAWSVSPNDGSVATVDQTGLLTGVAAGTATVTAKVGTVTQTATLTVENLTSIAITPAAVSIAAGTQTRFVATATLQDGTLQNISSSVTWITIAPMVAHFSSTSSTATISDALGSAGWATGGAQGSTTIGAAFGGQFATAQLTVTNATISTIAITPVSAENIALGTSQQYQATGTFSDSTMQDLSNEVTWTSSDPMVAVINGSGLATSTGVGTATVEAAGNINGVKASDMKVLTVH
jgi:Bacterial Ig-like domain (group 2)